jgi:hypothetical protein
MVEDAWWRELESSVAEPVAAGYWASVYRDLERTLTGIALERPEMAVKLREVRRRLHYWETHSEPSGAAEARDHARLAV